MAANFYIQPELRRALSRALGVFLLALSAFGCTNELPVDRGDESLRIDLRWIEAYPRERRSQVETGVLWILSFLGASLPASESGLVSWRGDVLTLRLDSAGIDSRVLPSWRQLLAALKASDEYERMGALDIGRFVALTLCSVRHYYALTGASDRYEDARATHDFDPMMAAIVESSVAYGNRLVELAQGTGVEDIAFIAHEGVGSVQQGSFHVTEHELLEVMPNGQLRFALYDTSGALKLSAGNDLTAAGKPSKCLWCHETELSRPFRGRTSVEGYHSLGEFEQQLADRTSRLHSFRSQMSSMIDFSRGQDHTYAELLYLSFYEPSAQRLANEWGLSVRRVEEMLAGLPTHANTEFSYLGERLYDRVEVDRFAPYAVIAVPTDPRESSAYEPDLMR